MINKLLILIFLERWLENRHVCAGPVTIVGMLQSNSGLGKAARLTMEALKKHKTKVTCFDISKFFNASIVPVPLPPTIEDDEGGVIIIQNSSIHLPFILFLLGRKKIANKKIIAYIAWELEVLPKSWVVASRLVDEIWVPSVFASHAFKQEKNMPPIKVIPHPLNILKHGHKIKLSSEITKYPKKILHISTLGAQFSRKNVRAVVYIFKKLYSCSKAVCLLLKISGHDMQQRQLINKMVGNANNIFIIDKNLSEKEIYGLIEASYMLLSLHRSEGFGLCIAEAMMLKTPVVATNWSANTEFFQNRNFLVKYKLVPVDDPQELSAYQYKQIPKWAEPDYKDAAAKIMQLIAHDIISHKYADESYGSIKTFLLENNSFQKLVKKSLEVS